MSKPKNTSKNNEESDLLEHVVILKRIESNFEKYQLSGKKEDNNLSFRQGKVVLTVKYKAASGTLDHGISYQEIRELFPTLINVDPSDRNFLPEVNKFYESLKVEVPFEGVRFNLSKDPVSGVYVSPIDYIKYKMICVSKKIAKPGDIPNPIVHRFYIEDPKNLLEEKRRKIELQDKAMAVYSNITDRFIDIYCVLRGQREPDKMHKETKRELVQKFMIENPSLFIEYYNGIGDEANPGPIYWKYKITEYVNFGILNRTGTIYSYKSEVIGTEIETVSWLKNERNSTSVAEMEARLRQMKPIV